MRKAFALRLCVAALMVFQSFPLRAEEPDAARRAELQQRLDAKLAELEAVQREVQQLQLELNLRPQLMVHVKMFEVSLTKMEQLGIRWEDFLVASKPEQSPGAETFGVVDRKALDVLFAKNLARVEADPTLVTVVGRPAKFHEGGEAPVGKTPDGQLKYEPFGTQVELLGTLIGKDRIQLELTAEHSEIDQARPIEIDGKKYPGRRVSKIQTSSVLKSGESMLLPGRTEERTEATLYTGGRTVTRINKIQSMMLVTVELMDAPLQGFSTVNLQGQQPPQPAGTGYASGGVQTKLVAPQPVQEIVEVNVQMMELSLTMLRNLGHDVDGSQYWIKAFGLEELHAANPVVDDYADVVLIPPSEEHGLTIEKHIGPLLESGAIKIVGQPRAITNSGEAILMELSSPGTHREVRAVPVAVVARDPSAIEKSKSANESAVQPVAPVSPWGYRLEMTPKSLDAKDRGMELELKFSLCEPLPGSSAKNLEDKTPVVVSTTERELNVSNGSVIFPGPKFRRSHLEIEGNRKREWLEEIVPVYIVVAGRKLLPAAPPSATASEGTTRK